MSDGLKRVLSSSKGLTAIAAIAAIVLLHVFHVSKETADTLTNNILILAGMYVGGTALEDVASKLKGGGGTPAA